MDPRQAIYALQAAQHYFTISDMTDQVSQVLVLIQAIQNRIDEENQA